MKVKIPFRSRFKTPLLHGTKIWTSRTKRYGGPGDTFDAFLHEFLIEKVERRTLEDVANHWKEEGCDNKEDFIEEWKSIHRRKGFVPTQRVHVHIFRRISI